MIVQGDLQMGARLGEVELASQLSISRTPIREALRRLVADGLVEVESNRGARVKSWTDEDIDDIFVLRSVLESHGASRAATALTDEEIDALEEMCAEMESLIPERHGSGIDRLNAVNRAFHTRILEGSRSTRLPALVSSVVQMPLAKRTFGNYSDEAMARSAHHHRELVAAFRARNPDWARGVMEAHIQAARFEVICWQHQEGEASAS